MVHRAVTQRLLSFFHTHPDQLHLHSGSSSVTVAVDEKTDLKNKKISEKNFQRVVQKIKDTYAEATQGNPKADKEGYYGTTQVTVKLEESSTNYKFSITKHPGNRTFSERVTRLIPDVIKNNPLAITSAAVGLLALGVGGYYYETSLSLATYGWRCVSSTSGISDCLSDVTTFANQLKATLIG